jgi:hypothetical protein
MPKTTAAAREARKGWAGHILPPRPNCQQAMVMTVEARRVTRKVFKVGTSS